MDSASAYEAHAHEFLNGRDQSLIGSQVVDQWSRTLSKGSAVIELGCGGGYPISRVLHEAGLKPWAIDSSPTLVAAFQSRFPATPIQCAKVQESDFFGRSYDAAIAIGLIFLLPESDQLSLIHKVSKSLTVGGRFLFTAPIETGEWVDMNTGISCQSLGQARYEGCLKAAGFQVLATFTDKGENNYYDVVRVS